MEISKKKRHVIYVKALELLRQDIKDERGRYENGYGMCSVLDLISEERYNYSIRFKHILEIFPEFGNQKPKKLKKEDDFWWPLTEYGFRKRVECLKKCIELTK